MKRTSIIGICTCLFFFGICLYSYLDMQNALTKVRIEVPRLSRALKCVEEENVRLKYAIEEFENPQKLMQLARGKDFSNLKFPLTKEVVVIKQGLAVNDPFDRKLDPLTAQPHIALATRQP